MQPFAGSGLTRGGIVSWCRGVANPYGGLQLVCSIVNLKQLNLSRYNKPIYSGYMLVVPYGGADGKMSHMHFGRAVPVTFRRFPSLACHNLLGKTVRVPEDLEGRLNVLVVGFKASHYMGMNSWMPLANRLKKELLIKHKTDESLVQVYRLVIR